jgi:PAS domain S-box-containing protein
MESSFEQDNDDDIGALGSILSWDDEDEAGVEASVAATSSALEYQEKTGCSKLPVLSFKKDGDDSAAFIRQFSGISEESDCGNGKFTIPMPYAVNCDQNQAQQQALPRASVAHLPQSSTNLAVTTQKSMQQPTQEVSTQPQPVQRNMSAPHQQPVQHAVNSGLNQQPQAMSMGLNQQPQAMNTGTSNNQFPVPTPQQMMQLPSFPMFQQQPFFATPNGQQQAMQFGMAQMMMQQAQASQPQQQAQQQQPSQQTQVQQNAFNTVLFQQAIQQAQQQAVQQFSMQQQSRQLASQSGSMVSGLPPQPVQSMAPGVLSQPVQAPFPQPKPAKRKAPPSSQPLASKRRSTVVSCSDTDGETSAKKAASRDSNSQSVKTTDNVTSDDETEVDTSDMNPEEKAKANRDRNREHARNTRLRKKAYLEKLKITVDELCRERDTLVTERAGTATLIVEMHNTRTEVLMSFFALRSANERRRELWASILDESCFACVMPVTPYRSFPASEVQVSKCQRTVLGIDGMMSDTASLHVMLNTLIDRSRFPTASIKFRFTLVTEDVVVAGNQMMARWAMTTTNAVQYGARMEVAKQGMLCAKFNSAHKIIGLELMFDVMAFMLQLKQATGSDSFSVVPNTVQTCQRSFDKPMVMTLAERPYTIVQVNKLWEDMTGYKAEDVVGKASCQVLQGQETDRKTLDALMTAVRYKRPASGMLVNYTRTRERFCNHLTFYPLSTDSKITHYVSLTTHKGVSGSRETSAAMPQPAAVPPQQGNTSQPLEGQAKLSSQSMVLPGAGMPPLIGGAVIQGGTTMAHPPLGFLVPQVATPKSLGTILLPIKGPPSSVNGSMLS